MVFLTLALVNKSVKFRLKKKQFLFIIFRKKKTNMYCISDSHFTVKVYEQIYSKVNKNSVKDPQINPKGSPNVFRIF